MSGKTTKANKNCLFLSLWQGHLVSDQIKMQFYNNFLINNP